MSGALSSSSSCKTKDDAHSRDPAPRAAGPEAHGLRRSSSSCSAFGAEPARFSKVVEVFPAARYAAADLEGDVRGHTAQKCTLATRLDLIEPPRGAQEDLLRGVIGVRRREAKAPQRLSPTRAGK
jgi:hypothetical protein